MSSAVKKVLAVDAALGGCVAALLDQATGEAACAAIETERDQAAKLVPMVQELLGRSGAAFADLGLIVTSTGPGSFTGLRIGLATARAWGLALGIPVQGVGTFEAMARSCGDADDRSGYSVLLETKRSDFYVRHFDAEFAPTSEGACLPAQHIAQELQGMNTAVCGNAIARFERESSFICPDKRERTLIDPAALARRGYALFTAEGYAEKPEPSYLREADVSISKTKKREILR